jgi:hypothetical protein
MRRLRSLPLKINFDNLDNSSLNINKLSKKDVIRTVTDPLIHQKVQLKDLTVLFYLRQEPNSSAYLLIFGQLTQKKIFEIGCCLRLRSDFVNSIGKEPLLLLQQLAENFGLEQRIGEKQSKFFLRETIQVPIGATHFTINEFTVTSETDVVFIRYTRYLKEVGIVDCALVITLDYRKYNAWLNKEAAISINSKKYDVFISYKRNTAQDFASNLKKCLTEEGYTTFLDLTDIPKEFEGTQKWLTVRDEAVKNSKRFLLIITIKIETSKEVPIELELARTVPDIKFMYFRHDTLKPEVLLETNEGAVINLGEGNQVAFSNENDLVRKVLQILQESNPTQPLNE